MHYTLVCNIHRCNIHMYTYAGRQRDVSCDAQPAAGLLQTPPPDVKMVDDPHRPMVPWWGATWCDCCLKRKLGKWPVINLLMIEQYKTA